MELSDHEKLELEVRRLRAEIESRNESEARVREHDNATCELLWKAERERDELRAKVERWEQNYRLDIATADKLHDQQLEALAKAEDKAAEARAKALEEAAKVVESAEAEVEARLANGKGEWPKPGYVQDAIWEHWRGQSYALRSAIRAIRALAEPKEKVEAELARWTVAAREERRRQLIADYLKRHPLHCEHHPLRSCAESLIGHALQLEVKT